MADWTAPEYSKAELDRLARLIVPWWEGKHPDGPLELGAAALAIQNWRSSHAMPTLNFRMLLTRRAKKVDQTAIVAQRLKRFSSVMNKLSREPNMRLSQMQDLGGCRAVLKDVEAVVALAGKYIVPRRPGAKEVDFRVYNYIDSPKDDGYRGVHLVGRYKALVLKNEAWNGHRIEIQLRTALQHAFATTVETVTTFTRSPLKFGGGDPHWRRFFSLMGSALALREQTATVPNTPHDRRVLKTELRDLSRKLRVIEKLRAWRNAMRSLPASGIKGARYLILKLDVENSTTVVTGYVDRAEASAVLAELERGDPDRFDAVLVWAPSLRKLRLAYPNYYGDTGAFIEALVEALR